MPWALSRRWSFPLRRLKHIIPRVLYSKDLKLDLNEDLLFRFNGRYSLWPVFAFTGGYLPLLKPFFKFPKYSAHLQFFDYFKVVQVSTGLFDCSATWWRKMQNWKWTRSIGPDQTGSDQTNPAFVKIATPLFYLKIFPYFNVLWGWWRIVVVLNLRERGFLTFRHCACPGPPWTSLDILGLPGPKINLRCFGIFLNRHYSNKSYALTKHFSEETATQILPTLTWLLEPLVHYF